MSENTTDYNYDDYFNGTFGDYGPCDNSSASNFRAVFLPTLYSLVFILGFIGNGLVLCVLLKHRNQTTLMDICLFNLALFDLLFVLSLPFFSHYVVAGEWIFGDFMCHLASGIHTFGFFGSIFFMVIMTLDRYVVIMHAHTVARHRTRRVGIALTMFGWMVSLCISLPSFIFTQEINTSSVRDCTFYSESSVWNDFSFLTMNILGLVVPLVVMIACYSRIIPTLVRMKTVKKHRVVKLIIAIVAIFFLFWTPYNIVLFVTLLKSKTVWEDDCDTNGGMSVATQVTEGLAYTHCCLNPIIYAFVGQKFMRRVVKLLRKWVPWCFPPSSRDVSESSFRRSSLMTRSSDGTSLVM